ncbi:hypothetical protein ACFWP5_37105 [Streptomyces sp. NPDC058469]|uniref:hypothetical protein n=1 Tax=Streptomyces sp. NPDC058469 TaxID=3346514 RepID=UPI0036509C1C
MRISATALSLVASTLAFGALSATGPLATATAAPAAGNCRPAVAQTRTDLVNAGAPTRATDWQSLRNAAQDFINSHPRGGNEFTVLRRDVNNLDTPCAP